MTQTLTPNFEKVVELFKEEAEELVKLALSEPATLSTKDGYGIVMGILTHLLTNPMSVPPTQRKKASQLFLIACERAGYPEDTADHLRSIMGWN